MKKTFNILLDPDPASASGGAPAAPVIPAGYISEAEANSRVEKARKEEKDKLYPRLTELENQLKKSQDDNTVLTQSLAALKQIQTSDGGLLDVPKLITELTDTISVKAQAQVESTVQDLRKRMEHTENENKAFRLSQVRADAIQKVGGEDQVISAMIGGDTEEAVRSSVNAAHQAYLTIEEGVKKRHGLEGQPANGPVVPVLPAPGAPSSGAIPTTGIRSMSPADYRANRDKLKKAAVAQFAPAAGIR